MLTAAQENALDHVRRQVEHSAPAAQERIHRLLAKQSTAFDLGLLGVGLLQISSITVNFHPDRLLADGRSVAEALLQDGLYRNQVETGISAGGLTAFSGGERDLWEERLFGGAYQLPGVAASDRPKYGGLNLARYREGACPRFGSCHLLLHHHVDARASFAFGDSVTQPVDWGMAGNMLPILAALSEVLGTRENLLGREDVTPLALLQALCSGIPLEMPNTPSRAFDTYVETHVHGPLDLSRDVESVVMDPSFRDTLAEAVLRKAAARFGFSLQWHSGYRMAADEFRAEFRGPTIPPLAAYVQREFGKDQALDAAVIGRAAVSVVKEPERWRTWGPPGEVLQYIKYL